MCGVFAIASELSLSNSDMQTIERFKLSMKHRGPDDDGMWHDKDSGIVIGHTRLAILDLTSAAKQPMTKDDVVLSYNGEIYNYKDIRAELQQIGYTFTSTGDTEVVLNSWIEWGDKAFEKFDGMFSVVIYDKGVLTLATDRFGEKTLYYSTVNNSIYISSELSTLTTELNLESSTNTKLDTLFMLNGYIPGPETFYNNTYRVLPAQIIKIQNAKIVEDTFYWRLPELKKNKLLKRKLSNSDLSLFKDILIKSIENRLSSDVPMCLFLSAGVDSSLIAAIIKKELNYDIDCITVSFGDSAYDESSQAKDVADYLNLNHETLHVDFHQKNNLSDLMLQKYGQPFATTTMIAYSLMTKAVREKYKVGLTGFGGDEIFFGYGKHSYAYKYGKIIDLNRGVKSYLAKLANSDYIYNNKRVRNWVNNQLNVKDSEKYTALKLFPYISKLRKLPFYNEAIEESHSNISDIAKYTYMYELTNDMPNSKCISLDLGSMSSGFELRTPFLNKDIVEEISNHDYRSFIAYGQKSVLRRLLKQYLPDNLVDRPKRGFVFPSKWIVDAENSDKTLSIGSDFNYFINNRHQDNNMEKLALRATLLNKYRSSTSS
jgi:asparagine synthase (glutamine-hydrolysing)